MSSIDDSPLAAKNAVSQTPGAAEKTFPMGRDGILWNAAVRQTERFRYTESGNSILDLNGTLNRGYPRLQPLLTANALTKRS